MAANDVEALSRASAGRRGLQAPPELPLAGPLPAGGAADFVDEQLLAAAIAVEDCAVGLLLEAVPGAGDLAHGAEGVARGVEVLNGDVFVLLQARDVFEHGS